LPRFSNKRRFKVQRLMIKVQAGRPRNFELSICAQIPD
jgi:hypothetical protein